MGAQGDIFRLEADIGFYYSLQSLDQTLGRLPFGGLMRAGNGMLYGLTSSGGDYDLGTLFLYDPLGFYFNRLHSFDGPGGRSPGAVVCDAPDGKLYGTTAYGGQYNQGVLFCFDPITGNYSVLHHFQSATGATPLCGPVYLNGSLWGLCFAGGQFGLGVLYRYDLNGSGYRLEFSFDRMNGALPASPLTGGSADDLYGVTSQGGFFNQGAVFRYAKGRGIYQKMHDFEGEHGNQPMGSLLLASDGRLYGTTRMSGSQDYSLLYRINPATFHFESLFDFDWPFGAYPQGSLVEFPRPIGVSEPEHEAFHLYPVPSHGDVHYELPGGSAAIRLSVIAVTGQEVLRIDDARESSSFHFVGRSVYHLA
jgi:uncharacterized repeat protein (TIGR03803 family)